MKRPGPDGIQGSLFDQLPAGRREERTEWGCRYRRATPTHKRGDVDIRPGESAARFCITDEAVGYGYRLGDCEVVKRTIVTYTGAWEVV